MLKEYTLKTGEKCLVDYVESNNRTKYADMHTHYFDEETMSIEYEGDSDEAMSPYWHLLLASDLTTRGIPSLFEYYSNMIIKYLCDNHNPHTIIIVNCNSAELLHSVKSNITSEFIKD